MISCDFVWFPQRSPHFSLNESQTNLQPYLNCCWKLFCEMVFFGGHINKHPGPDVALNGLDTGISRNHGLNKMAYNSQTIFSMNFLREGVTEVVLTNVGSVYLSIRTWPSFSCRCPNTQRCSTQWSRLTHIRVNNLTIIGSDNGLSPGRRQAIIWTSAGILFIRPYGTNFNEILNKIRTFSLTKMYLKMSSGICRPFCLGLNCVK